MIHVVCDFDSTLATTFVGGTMFRGYAPADRLAEFRKQYVSGEFSLRQYQEAVFDIAGQTTAEMSERAVATAGIRPFAREAYDAVVNSGGIFAVASAGLDFYIEPVIRNAGFDQAEVHSGRVVSESTQPPPFRYDYPSVEKASKTNPCKGDWVTCKCEVIRQIRHGGDESDAEVIFIGDGVLSDTCAAENAADNVFATGRLLEYCRENQIPAIEFGEDFAPVLEYVMNKTSENGDR